MVTLSELKVLEHGLRLDKVLSVFLGQAPSDPAARHGWRVRIDEAIREVRKAGASASHRERAEMERAINRFESTLAEAGGVIREPGWVGYVGADRVHLAQVAPVAMTTSASWGNGIRIAPLLRAIQEARPAIIAMVDSRRAVLYRYYDGHSAARRHIARACPHRAWHPYGQRAATALSRGHPRTHRDGPSAARTSCGTPASHDRACRTHVGPGASGRVDASWRCAGRRP